MGWKGNGVKSNEDEEKGTEKGQGRENILLLNTCVLESVCSSLLW